MVSEQIDDEFDSERPLQRRFRHNVMKRTDLERVVQRNGDHVNRWSFMPQPDVAALLPDHEIAKPLQCENDAICRNASAISCGFDRNQFVLYVVQLHEPRLHLSILKMY